MANSVRRAKEIVLGCLNRLYRDDSVLFLEKGLCERCLVFRFAHYLQLSLPDYKVDCDYNESTDENAERRGAKKIDDVGRFIDIIVHKRLVEDYFCIELKRWDNYKGRDKDRRNLEVLTRREMPGQPAFDYKVGFHIILGKRRDDVKWNIFEGGTGQGEEFVPALLEEQAQE
jgi:hypothetical protein